MIQSPRIMSPIEFSGLVNKIILIECDEEDNAIELIYEAIKENVCVYYSKEKQDLIKTKKETISIFCDDINKATKCIRRISSDAGFHIIHRIDLMNLSLTKKIRGSQIKAYISMLSNNILRGSNVIITSCRDEYTLREIADQYINLRKKQNNVTK